LKVEILLGALVPVIGVGMWFTIHKWKNTLLLMHGSKPSLPSKAKHRQPEQTNRTGNKQDEQEVRK
jgi:hypothetical protein